MMGKKYSQSGDWEQGNIKYLIYCHSCESRNPEDQCENKKSPGASAQGLFEYRDSCFRRNDKYL